MIGAPAMSLHKAKLLLHWKSLVISGAAMVILAVITTICWSVLAEKSLLIVLPVSVGMLGLIQLEVYYRSLAAFYQQDEKFQAILQQQNYQQIRQTHDYYQIESLFSIFSLLRFKYPLPPMREWAISPDFAKQLIGLIYQQKPQLIVEVSSGISSVIMGYCLQALGSGQVISLEHDERYAKITSSQIQNHDLQDTVQILHAPLKAIGIGDKIWRWYDFDPLELPCKIDLLVIDGPPGDLQPLSRYPALPLLFHALSDNCTVILDDGNREDEQKIVELWQQAFDFDVEKIHNEKGAFLLRRKLERSNPLLSHAAIS